MQQKRFNDAVLLAGEFLLCNSYGMSELDVSHSDRTVVQVGGRKPGPSPKWTTRIELRLSPEQYEKLERIANSKCCSRGSLLRAWIASAAETVSE